jgi:hypothetical protein
MVLRVDKIVVDNPRPAHTGFNVPYWILNDGPDEPPFELHIQMWSSSGSQPLDLHEQLDGIEAGLLLGATFAVPALEPGIYDVSLTLPDGSGKGESIHVQ